MRNTLIVFLVFMLALTGGAFLMACGEDEEAPGAARRGWSWDGANSRGYLWVDGTEIMRINDTGTEVDVSGDLSTDGTIVAGSSITATTTVVAGSTVTAGTGFTVTTGDFTNTAGGDLAGWQKNYETHAANDTLTVAEVGSLHTSVTQTGNVTLTLPVSSTAGDQYHFVVGNGSVVNVFKVKAPAGGAIYLNGTKGTDAYVISANDEGESVSVIAIGTNDWVAFNRVGTWTAEVGF